MTITIELTKGQVTLIDDEDADLADFSWWAHATHNGYYAYGRIHGTLTLLHRAVLARVAARPLTRNDATDHINGNKLDNRRENLRIATYSQNQQNRGRTSRNTSGFKGVSFDRIANKWGAWISVQGRTKYLGRFDTPEAAHEAYCKAALELHGEFANTGSPVTVENK